MMDANIESLIHALCMAAWDAGAESGTVWCPDADMSKRGVVPMTQDEGFAHAREHFARHGGGSESSAFDQALAALRAELARIKAAPVVVPDLDHEERSHLETIGQRDAAEDCIEKLLGILGLENGREYEWSSAFGFADAVGLAEDAASRLRTAQPGEIAVSKEEWEDACREISAWRDATKANERTKAIHIGQHLISLNVVDDDGEEAPWNTPVPWVIVKEIMDAIRSDKSRLVALRARPTTNKKEKNHG